METDYLVAGAGTLGMGFVDTLLDHSDADVIIVDRNHGPGGHWLDAYPFVRLHQPSKNYGVNSTPLGRDRIEAEGRDEGFFERASGLEICAYFDEVLRHRFLSSGRVRFLPMSEYLGDGRIRSQLTGEVAEVTVRCRVVDATYMASRVPATDPPPFTVDPGAVCIPAGRLVSVKKPPAGYVIIGAGKTAADAVGWLLDRGTPPEVISWIRPRDPWLLNRAYFQPGTGSLTTFGGIVTMLEAVAECDTVEDVFDRLEADRIVVRLDATVRPSTVRGATVSLGELGQLQRITNVVRMGHVLHIAPHTISLEDGEVPTGPHHVHVHCASPGLGDNPPRPIFGDERITLQPVTRASISLSAGLLGVVEASGRSTAEKNRLCPPNMWFDTPFDWLRHILTGIRTEMGWAEAPDVGAWLEASRLNLLKGLPDGSRSEVASGLQVRFLDSLVPALAKLDRWAATASGPERARIFDPPPASGSVESPAGP